MANEGIAPPDFSSPIGQVRALTQDVDPENVNEEAHTGDYLWMSDDQITTLLALHQSDVWDTAIYIWRMVGITPAMTLKKWDSADLGVDGPAITNAIRGFINDIEKKRERAALSGIIDIIPTGASVSQPALVPEALRYSDGELDPTLPAWIV